MSGGCIEDDLIERVRRHGVAQRRPEAVEYGVGADEARRFGLPCGGTIRLVLKPPACVPSFSSGRSVLFTFGGACAVPEWV